MLALKKGVLLPRTGRAIAPASAAPQLRTHAARQIRPTKMIRSTGSRLHAQRKEEPAATAAAQPVRDLGSFSQQLLPPVLRKGDLWASLVGSALSLVVVFPSWAGQVS
jgi:hypothetical protein